MELLYLMLLLLTIALILRFYRYLIANNNYWKKRGVPSADGVIPGIGHMWPSFSLQEKFNATVKSIYEAHTESMVGLFTMRQPMLIIKDPELIKTVLQSEFNSFRHHRTLDTTLDPLLHRNVFFLNDKAWKDSRSKFLTIVTAKKLKIFSLVVQKVALNFVHYMNNQLKRKNFVEFEGGDMFKKMTVEVATSAVLSIENGSFDEASPMIFHKIMKSAFEPSILQALKAVIFQFSPFLCRIFKVGFIPYWINAEFSNTVGDLLKKRKNDKIERNDMLQILIDMYRDKGLDDQAMICDIFSFIFEIFGTSSITLSFIACDLAQYPHIQEKLREEINAVASKFNGEISYEAINEMTYLDQVLSESIRLNPVSDLRKICTEPAELIGSDGIRCRMKPGDRVLIPVYALQRDPQHWSNPEEFRPERFDKASEEFQRRHKYTYIPFGEGPRMCPGMRMGLLQVKIFIATIVKNFVIEKSPKLREPVELDPGHFLSFIRGGAWVRLRHLSS